MAITKEKAIDILEKFDFFQGQRAGREIWNDKPFDVQEEDLKNFARDIALLKDFINAIDVVPKTEGEWVVTENGCVITCSECGHRLELCYPDGTEVRSLPACPICGVKMKGKETTKKHFSPEEVLKMTPKEVRENLAVIMNSMKEWK